MFLVLHLVLNVVGTLRASARTATETEDKPAQDYSNEDPPKQEANGYSNDFSVLECQLVLDVVIRCIAGLSGRTGSGRGSGSSGWENG